MSDLRDELEEALDEAEWEWLAPHSRRDALIVVDTTLALADVGVALANDNTSIVQQWITTQQIRKPSLDEIAAWSQDTSRRFTALIVQPYVLIHDRQPAT